MARAVLADHVLFNECIHYLREDLYRENKRSEFDRGGQTFSCISTTFNITKPWIFEKFTIYPSREIILPAGYKSLLNFVENPSWVKDSAFVHPHLFGEVLGALISFVTLRSVKSPRNGHCLMVESMEKIQSRHLEEMALTLPFLSTGPGAHDSILEEVTEDKFIKEAQELINSLEKFDEVLYGFTLEVIRLVQLSLLVKRDDFGLAYLLLVSAIEAIAQDVFEKDKSQKHDKEIVWKERAKTDQEFNELLSEYQKLRGKPTLTSKFIRLIFKYSPPEEWENLVKSRDRFMDQEWSNFRCGSKHPSKMQKEEIEQVLKNAYNYRSRFVHQGKQPPHQRPEAYLNKFFEVIGQFEINSDDPKYELSPSYELMLAIAKTSISKWIESKSKSK